MSQVTTVQLPTTLASEVDRLANTLNRPRDWVIEQAVARYIEDEAWQVHATAEALALYQAQIATGSAQGRDFDEAMDELEAKYRAKLAGQRCDSS